MVVKRAGQASATALILAGGKSSRLFPFNKVLSDLTGSGRTLLQQARDRLKGFPKDRVYVLTTRDMTVVVRKQLALPASHILVDPARRGTWPAILWAMVHLRRKDPDTVLAVLTGDHVIQNDRAFAQSLKEALRVAEEKPAFVMMGVTPRRAPEEWRGFGCFRVDKEGLVSQFQEKPSIVDAERMVEEGGWLWNSGMFFFRISIAEKALRVLQPEMAHVYEAICAALASGKKVDAASLFNNFPDKIPHPLDPGRTVDNSIDYAILTPLVDQTDIGLEARAVQNLRFVWTDLGQWDALRTVLKSDRQGNIRVGKIALEKDVRNSIFVAEKGLTIEARGVQDVIVAFAGKKALVVAASDVSQVKEAAQEALKRSDRVVSIGVPHVAIQLKGKRLVVSAKGGIIR